jgi:hypothetical protein
MTCDQVLTLGGATLTIPAGASLTLTVTPTAPGGTGTSVSEVAPAAVMAPLSEYPSSYFAVCVL